MTQKEDDIGKVKYCPLMSRPVVPVRGDWEVAWVRCQREGCRFWDLVMEACAFEALWYIFEQLGELQ